MSPSAMLNANISITPPCHPSAPPITQHVYHSTTPNGKLTYRTVVHPSNDTPSRHQALSDAGPHSDQNKNLLYLPESPAVKFEQSAQSREMLKCQVPPVKFDCTSGSNAPASSQSTKAASSPVVGPYARPTTQNSYLSGSNQPPSTPTPSSSRSTYPTPTRLVSTWGANKTKWYTVITGRRTGIFDNW
jgi:hypothetical protein